MIDDNKKFIVIGSDDLLEKLNNAIKRENIVINNNFSFTNFSFTGIKRNSQIPVTLNVTTILIDLSKRETYNQVVKILIYSFPKIPIPIKIFCIYILIGILTDTFNNKHTRFVFLFEGDRY